MRRGYDRAAFRVWEKSCISIRELEGWMLDDQCRWLLDMAHWLPDGSTILEIGAFKGQSTACLGMGCKGTAKHVFALDTYRGNDTDFVVEAPFYTDWAATMARFDLAPWVTPCFGRSSAFYKYWVRPIEFLFIDGSHEYEDVLLDYENFYPRVAPGGIIALHDVGMRPDKDVGFEGPHRVWFERASKELTHHGRCSTLVYGRKPL